MNRAVARCIPVLALVCALAAPAWAGAATKYDTSYQNGGMLLLPSLRGVYGQVAQSCQVTGKKLSIAGRFGPSSQTGGWRSDHRLGIAAVSLRPRQPMTLGVADVRWHMQRVPTRHVVLDQSFADDGSFAYVTRSPRKSQASRLKLFRVDATGARAKSFGHKGYISVTVAGLGSGRRAKVRVFSLAAGKVLLLAETSDTQVLLRYTRTGRPDQTWGNGGVVELAAPSFGSITGLRAVDSATVTDAGGLLLSANGAPGKPASTEAGLLKLTAAGRVDTKWSDGGFWLPPAPKGTIDFTVSRQTLLTSLRKGGDFAALYTDGRPGSSSRSVTFGLAYIDKASGVTTLFNDKAGNYSGAGPNDDSGTPDAEPWILARSSAGTIFAHAEGWYENPGGTFRGEATRFSADADQPEATAAISNPGFATGDFAVDPAAKYLYFCGSYGTTSKNAKDPAKRSQRRAVAVKRVAL